MFIYEILAKDCTIDSSQKLIDGVKCVGDSGVLTLQPGTYPIKNWANLGSWNAPHTGTIKIKGADNGKVIVNGGFKIEGWVQDETYPDLLKTTVPQSIQASGDKDDKATDWRFKSLWVNDHETVRARIPSTWTLPTIKSFSTSSCDNSRICKHTVKVPAETMRFLDGLPKEDYQDINIVIFHYWSTTRAYIDSYSAKDNTITYKAHSYNGDNNKAPEPGKSTFYLDNFKRALTKPGEWFLTRDGTLYYYPLPGETASNIEAYASDRKRLMYVESQNIIFENIEFRYCGGDMPTTGMTREDNLHRDSGMKVIDVNQATNIQFINCQVRHCFFRGISIWASKNCLVSGCLIEDFGAVGIAFGNNQNSKIYNNILRHGGRFLHYENAIYDNFHPGGVISHNDISDMFWDGINVFGDNNAQTSDMVIEKNHVHHIG